MPRETATPAAVLAVESAVRLLRGEVERLKEAARAEADNALETGDRRGTNTWRGVLVDLSHALRALDTGWGWVETAAGRLGLEVADGDGG